MKKEFVQMNLAVVLWGFTAPLGRAISMPAPVLVWYRMLIAAVVLFLIITFRKGWPAILPKDIKRLTGIGILFAFHWLAFYGSVKLANVSIAVVCLASASVFTAIFDPLINHQKFNKNEILLSILAILGVLSIYAFHSESAVHPQVPMVNFNLGLLLGMTASVISSLFSVLNKPLAEKYPARPLVFSEMMAGFVFLSLLAPFYIYFNPEAELLPAGYDYLWIIILGYCCTVWALSLTMSALKTLSPFTVTLSVNLEPIYGILLAFLFFKENNQLGAGFYLGLILIFTSVGLQAVLTLRAVRQRKKKAFALNRIRHLRWGTDSFFKKNKRTD